MPTSKISRRNLLFGGVFSEVHRLHASAPLIEVPVLRLLNRSIALNTADVERFFTTVWDEAVRAFLSCDVELRTVQSTGDIRQYPSGRPRFIGLERKMLNVVITDTVPLHWTRGRSLAGVATIYEGYHLIVIAVKNAYNNRLPFLAVNTVVHELLHVFRGDIFVRRAGLLHGADREAEVDWQATRLWILGNGADINECARKYVKRLAAGTAN